MTTTRSPLSAVPEFSGSADMAAVSEAARSATLAQNLAAATRLEAAHLLVGRWLGLRRRLKLLALSVPQALPGRVRGRVVGRLRGWIRSRGRGIIWRRRVR